jgi:diamine N-acetyltransferase
LREITSENLRTVLALKVSEKQKRVYPRSNAYSIAEAHYPRDDDPVWMRAVYADEVPVGFIMTSEAPQNGEYFLWRLMIDESHQGNGYGKAAVELLVARIDASGNGKFLLTDHIDGDGSAGDFYSRLGFHYTGEVLSEGERVMRRDF